MVSATDPRPEPLDNEMVMPTWLFWLQLGLSTMLAVLFVVTLVKTRQQSLAIRDLQDKIAGIENSRALDRTTAIEDQLRSTSERLQAVERQGAQMAALIAENARLRQAANSAAAERVTPTPPPALDGAVPPPPPIKP
ncbi:MAG: hypothetical protein FJ077_00485 [Cyanobacteria bacterium K_DeepCast_35m_m2_023]|nr:hypothetical protein [Cyanobacteria bacterium K_DeepCast_35m_m2_023]